MSKILWRVVLAVASVGAVGACVHSDSETTPGDGAGSEASSVAPFSEIPPEQPAEPEEHDLMVRATDGSSEPITQIADPGISIYVVESTLSDSNDGDVCVVTQSEEPLGEFEKELGMESGGTSFSIGCGSMEEGLVQLIGNRDHSHVVVVGARKGSGRIRMREAGAVKGVDGVDSADAEVHEVPLGEPQAFKTQDGIEGFVSVMEVDLSFELDAEGSARK